MNAFFSRWLRALAALTCLLSGVTSAAIVHGLYEGQVEVVGEQEAQRQAAQGRALRQVLGKLSGTAVPGGAVVEAAMAEPQRYLQQYAYREGRDTLTPLTLWASFEVTALDALLREAGLPQWSAQRPDVLVWLTLAVPGHIELLAPDSAAPDDRIQAALNRRAWERGIPIIFPLLDLEDRGRIQAVDVSQLDVGKIVAASARYGAGVVLVGRIEAGGTGAWSARWSMIESADASHWTTRGLSAAATAAQAVDEVTDRLAARYAVHGEGAESIDVRIIGVRSVNDYARALDYLKGLDQVSGLVFNTARENELQLRMRVRGGVEALRRVTAFGDVLRAESAPALDGGLSFRLLP